jgi:hypothetical protein
LQNIDPVWFLEPASFVALGVGLVLYWYYKRRFSMAVFASSFVAYAGAIALKEILQYLIYASFDARFGSNDYALGLYFGLQTVFFEVGLAYLVVRFAVGKRKLQAEDAEGFGIGLGFWENAILLGALSLVSLVADYALIMQGGGLARTVYDAINRAQPSLFDPPLKALPLMGFPFLERITSAMFHFCWGYLCVIAAIFGKRRYFFMALPMGLLDFLVPFAPTLGVVAFEILIFVLGIGTLALTLFVTRGVRSMMRLTQGGTRAEQVTDANHPL